MSALRVELFFDEEAGNWHYRGSDRRALGFRYRYAHARGRCGPDASVC
jgi:hypothetical protein